MIKARKTGTNWTRLKHMTDAKIRAGIRRDPDARATDGEFLKKARLVMPTRAPRRRNSDNATAERDVAAEILEGLDDASKYLSGRKKRMRATKVWGPRR